MDPQEVAAAVQQAENDGPPEFVVVGDKIDGYEIVGKLGEGASGRVYECVKDKIAYALKTESNTQEGGCAIKLESSILRRLKGPPFPKFLLVGRKPEYSFMVLELLGKTVQGLKMLTEKDFWNDGTWPRIGIQILYALKCLHDQGYIHRDLKPGNIAIGRLTPTENRSRTLVLIGYGLARRFVKDADPEVESFPEMRRSKPGTDKYDACNDLQFMTMVNRIRVTRRSAKVEELTATAKFFRPMRENIDFHGTPLYASINSHNERDLGRVDDIWSLMYMIAELVQPLPWEENDQLADVKKATSLPNLFIDKTNPGLITPDMVAKLEKIEKNLKQCNIYSKPDYNLIYEFFLMAFQKSGAKWTSPYEWEKPSDQLTRSIESAVPGQWQDPKDFFKSDVWAHLKLPEDQAVVSLAPGNPPAATQTEANPN